MAPSEVHIRAIIRAVDLMGGTKALARHLGVPEPAVRLWLSGGFVPTDVFLRIVDLVIDRDIEAIKNASPSQRREA